MASLDPSKATFSIKKVKGKSKSGNDYTAYQISVGLYKTPLLFPDDVSQAYLDAVIAGTAHSDFKRGSKDDEPLDDLDD